MFSRAIGDSPGDVRTVAAVAVWPALAVLWMASLIASLLLFSSRGWGAVAAYVDTMDPRSIHDASEREKALGYGVMNLLMAATPLALSSAPGDPGTES